MDSPLLIPEVLLGIFDFLELEQDRSTLAAACRVSKTWCAYATEVLWRTAPCQALAGIADDRAQLYASKVTMLEFTGSSEAQYHYHWWDLQFIRLRHLCLDSYRAPSGVPYPMQQYLHASLQTLEFYGGDLAASVLTGLLTNCPRLRDILIDSPGSYITPRMFLSFIKDCKSLERVTFVYGMDHLVTDELFLHLARRPNLTHLTLGRHVPTAVYDQLVSESSHAPALAALRFLQVPISSEAVPLLAPMINKVTSLGLEIRDGRPDFLHHLSSLTDLSELMLEFAINMTLPSADLMCLRSHPKLHTLRLRLSPDILAPRMWDIPDAVFENLIAKLSQLRILAFEVPSSLSAHSLKTLAREHPLLEELSFLQPFHFPHLDLSSHPGVLFPKLRMLEVGGFYSHFPFLSDEWVSRFHLRACICSP